MTTLVKTPDLANVAALIERAQAGDVEAKADLYRRYVDVVFRFTYGRVGRNRQVAEDLTADVFERALKRLPSFTWQGKDLAAWLVSIARNLVADHFKSGRARKEIARGSAADLAEDRPSLEPEPSCTVVDGFDALQMAEDVRRAMWQLTPEQRRVVELRFFDELSVAETARVLGKEEGAVKALTLRAVRAMGKLLVGGAS